MGPEKEVKSRRPRRSKADIEAAINKAATAQIKKKGFSMALVTDIVNRANIEPVVFYNRYKNLNEFYDTFVKNYDYWLSDLFHNHADKLDTKDGYAQVLKALLRNLADDQIMTEILRWEISEGNHITERTSKLRELHSVEIIEKFNEAFRDSNIEASAITTMLVAGIYYIILHKDRSAMAGIDINSADGMQRLDKAIDSVAEVIFHEREAMRREQTIRQRMLDEGLSEEAIDRILA